MKFAPKIIIGVVVFIVVLILVLNIFVIVQAGNVRVLTPAGLIILILRLTQLL